MHLKRTASAEALSIYQAENGAQYLLKAVNREYPEGKKAPRYFLSLKVGSDTHYFSGLFPTKRKGIFSLDRTDEAGIKTLWRMYIEPGGERAILEPGDAKEMRIPQAARK